MIERSFGQFLVRTTDVSAVVAAVDSDLRRFRFRRLGPSVDLGPKDALGARGAEVREAVLIALETWTAVVVEDVEGVFGAAYSVHTALRLPVVASRAFKFGAWQMKAYVDRDLVVKVGDDPDRELPWVGNPLSADRVAEVAKSLGGGESWVRFCSGVTAGRPDHNELERAIGGASLRLVFQDVVERAGRVYVAWTTVRD